MLLKCIAQKYTKQSQHRFRNKVAKLQKERAEALPFASRIESSADQYNASPSTTGSRTMCVLDKLLDEQIQMETRQCMLRLATRWHEQGERNNKYFYRVIKSRQVQQTIQFLKCSETGSIAG